MSNQILVCSLDIVGTVVFAVSGAIVGSQRRLDLFGVLVLAVATATAGGVMRDVLIGVIPPQPIGNWHILALTITSGLFAVRFQNSILRLGRLVQLLDSVGLGVFAVTGTEIALLHEIPPAMAAVLGMVSAIGGGIARDLLTARTPVVLTSEIYALAALAGGMIVAAGHTVGLTSATTALPGAVACCLLRMTALYRGWSLPSHAPSKDCLLSRSNRAPSHFNKKEKCNHDIY